VIKKWEKEHLHLGNTRERRFIYVADAAEEEHIMLGGRDARLVASEPQRRFEDTLGRTRKLVEREPCENALGSQKIV